MCINSVRLSTERMQKLLNNSMSKQIYSRTPVIASPISGQPCKPTINTFIRDKKRITEASYIDPASGTFIRKVIVSVEDIEKPSE